MPTGFLVTQPTWQPPRRHIVSCVIIFGMQNTVALFGMLISRAAVLDPKKHIYSQGFSIYGLSEYYLATHENQALEKAIGIFELIEQHAFDPDYGGYFESYKRDWSLAEDFRLSEKEQNDPKTMNTHLHLLEPYTNLLRAWNDPHLRQQQHRLIRTFLDHIIELRNPSFRIVF